jgi:hypothetical protein
VRTGRGSLGRSTLVALHLGPGVRPSLSGTGRAARQDSVRVNEPALFGVRLRRGSPGEHLNFFQMLGLGTTPTAMASGPRKSISLSRTTWRCFHGSDERVLVAPNPLWLSGATNLSMC